MKKLLTTIALAFALSGCATWKTADGFEAGRLANGAVMDTAALACEGEDAEKLTNAQKQKCDNLKLASEKLDEAIDAFEDAWEDIAPILGLPAAVTAPKTPEKTEEP